MTSLESDERKNKMENTNTPEKAYEMKVVATPVEKLAVIETDMHYIAQLAKKAKFAHKPYN